MPAFRITGFSGMVPRLDARLLQPNQAQLAVNVQLLDGALVPLRQPQFEARPNKSGTILTIYLMRDAAGNHFWLSWTRRVSVAKAPVAGDTLNRIYYTGDGEPRMTTLAEATQGLANDYPKGFFVLGVTKPTVAPTVTPSGGTGATVSRSYAYTFVTQFGEESAPSPESALVNGKVDDTWAISAMETAPPNSGTISGAVHAAGVVTLTVDTTRGLRAGEEVTHADVVGMTDLNGTFPILEVVDATHYTVSLTTAQVYAAAADTWTRVAPHNTASMVKRIYRTVGTSFFFVAEIPAATTSHNDTLSDAVVSKQGVLRTNGWEMPPTDLHSLVEISNGMMAGLSGNVLCFAEPFSPYAWPVGYQQALPFTGVALAASGSSVVVATEGKPFVFSGTHPSGMSQEKPDVAFPGLSARGTVGVGGGGLYPTHQGLALVGPGVTAIATKDIYTPDQWKRLNPDGFVAAFHDGRYYAAFNDGTGQRMLIIDKSEAAQLVEANVSISAIYADLELGRLFIVENGDIKRWDGDVGVRMLFEWLSKEFVLPKPHNIGAAKVDAAFTQTEEEIAALQAARDAVVLANRLLIGKESVVRAGTTTNGSAVVQNLASTADLVRWMTVQGAGIPLGAKIKEVNNSTTITLTAAATATGTPDLTFDGGPQLVDGGLAAAPFNRFAFNASAIRKPPTLNFETLQFTLYVDGQVKFSKNIGSGKGFALPAGYKTDNLAVRAAGNVRVRGIVVATSMQALEEA